MATTKGKSNTNTRKKSSSKSSSGSKKTASKSTATKTSTKPRTQKTKKQNEDYDAKRERDPFFEDSTKEIILWVSIAVCILLLISNFGLGGTIGNSVAGFLFGFFGLIQYIIPFLLSFAAFFLISNYGNKVAIAKVIAATVLIIFIGVFFELFLHGQDMLSPQEAFEYSREHHTGGGYLGGLIASLLASSFGLFGAYLIDVIMCIINLVIIVERFAFDKVQRSSQYHSDRAAAKRRDRRERMMIEREVNQTRFNNNRQAIREKLEADYQNQLLEDEVTEGPRRNRKHSGVTTNTILSDGVQALEYQNDGVNEIRFNASEAESVEVTQTTRHKLVSNKASDSRHSFNEQKPAKIEPTPVISEEKTNIITEPVEKTKKTDLVINMPSSDQFKEVTTPSPAPKKVETVVEATPVPTTEQASSRKAKPSAGNANEIDNEEAKVAASMAAAEARPKKPYTYPPIDLLNVPKTSAGDSKEFLNMMASKLQQTLKNFGVDAEVKEVTLGPSVTQYKISIDQGTKVSKVINLSDDIKLNLAVTDVRIEAPIPGEPYIGIEVPNKQKTMVGFRELVSSKEFKDSKSKISFCVGKDISGKVIVGNIEKMPHLLIAGATGSGKSVCINTIIMSILYHASPDEVKLIMVDPKMVELSVYNGIPHLLIPVVTDAKKAAGALHWAVKEMTDRYELMAAAGVRNLEGFNEKVLQDALPDTIPEAKRTKMSQIVVVLDELADLMMVAAADVEDSIVRLAQLARAAGIHLIIATQRPTANVITGLIKANVPSRIAFSVSSGTDSRVIIDMNGAEDLLGNGDMLYAPQNLNKPVRVQGAFVSDEEVARVVDFLKDNNEPVEQNSTIQEEILKNESSNGAVAITGEVDNSLDPLFGEAGRLVIENQKGSIGYLQRNFRIGFNRAARIMDQLCEKGVVGPEMGTKPREIRMSISELEELLNTL